MRQRFLEAAVASRFIVGMLPMLIALFSGPVGAEFDERDSTTAHRQQLFPTEFYRNMSRQDETKSKESVDRVCPDVLKPSWMTNEADDWEDMRACLAHFQIVNTGQ